MNTAKPPMSSIICTPLGPPKRRSLFNSDRFGAA
jgi:hypothetical protein